MAEKGEEYEVTVLTRGEVTTYPVVGAPEVVVQTTYVAAGLPPSTVSIPKKEWSPEREKEEIKKDIQKRLKMKPETFRISL